MVGIPNLTRHLYSYQVMWLLLTEKSEYLKGHEMDEKVENSPSKSGCYIKRY